jgi:hypothetical protein
LKRTKQALAVAAGVVVAALVVVGGYLGGWWLKADTTDRQVGIDNRNTGTQTAWRDEAHDKVDDYLLLDPDSPAAQSLRNSACDLIGRLTDPYVDDDLADFQATEC